MKAVILVAGLGSRLRPYTNELPKALVPLNGRPLLEYQLSILRRCGVSNISLVTGYIPEAFNSYGLSHFHNDQYASSNMVYSLMQARSLFDGQEDLLICYGDIVYDQKVLDNVINSPGSLVVSADLDWLSLWQLRMDNPYSDAESFIMERGSQRICSLGQKIQAKEDAQAQYIGLLKVSAEFQSRWLEAYDNMPSPKARNLYMTDFIQALIDEKHVVTAALHNGGWLEVDSVQDKQRYENTKSVVKLLNKLVPA
ncbi:MAG: nucleotidyl transferase [Alteromonas sp.]|nr:nucleotidyl transferase [Alteromonas sp.]